MTVREAVSTLQRVLLPAVDEFNKQDAPGFAQVVDEAWKIVREAALKAENNPSDARSTTKGMFIPECPEDVDLLELERRVTKLELKIARFMYERE